MTLLTGIRNWFTRWRHPVEIETTPSPPDRTVAEVEDKHVADVDVVAVAEIEAEQLAEPAVAPVEAGITSQEAEELFTREGDRIASLLDKLDVRIGAQAAETQKLTQQLTQKTEQLPELVEGVTQIKTQCGRTLELLLENLSQGRSSEEAVATAVQCITDASAHDVEELGRIRRQLDANTQAIRDAGQATESVTGNLREIAEVTSRLQAALAKVESAGEQRETNFARLLMRQKRSMSMFAVGCSMASIMALIVALIAIFI